MLNSLKSLLQLLAQNHESVRPLVARNEQYNHWHIPSHVVLRANAFLTQIETTQLQFSPPTGSIIGVYANEQIPLEALATCLLCFQTGHPVQLRFQTEQPLATWFFNQWLSLSPQLAQYLTVQQASLTHCHQIIVPAASTLHQLPGREVFQMPQTRAIAQLIGNETNDELFALCNDVFTYFGRSELNVGLLLVPDNYNFEPFLRQADKFIDLRQVNIYANHYEYQRFTLLLNLKEHLDNEVILLRADSELVPKTGVLHHAKTSDFTSLPAHSQLYSANAQVPHSLPFGTLSQTAWWANPQLLTFLK